MGDGASSRCCWEPRACSEMGWHPGGWCGQQVTADLHGHTAIQRSEGHGVCEKQAGAGALSRVRVCVCARAWCLCACVHVHVCVQVCAHVCVCEGQGGTEGRGRGGEGDEV